MNVIVYIYMKKQNFGFTLIELMVVISVIALLSGVALLGLRRVQSLGRDTRRISDLERIRTGLEVFFERNRFYPQLSGVSWTSDADTFPTALIGAGIGVFAVQTDPLNRTPFVYTYSSESPWTGYVLRALLENNDNAALRNDIDGTVFGIDCGPATFPEGTSGTNSFYCTRL